MREIKFRKWCEPWSDKTYKMVYSGNVKEDNNGDNFYFGNGIIMQYTGLKDRENKEIYEGDIIELKCETTEGFYRTDRLEVIWDDMNAQFALKRGNMVYLELNMDLHEAIVVGNVFETPELIEA